MKLNISEWKEFKTGHLFDIHPTKSLKNVTSNDCVKGGMTPLVVNQSYNNGVAGNVNYKPTEKGGIITFSDTWEGKTFFYQRDAFIGFSHVQGMYPKQKMSENVLIFMSVMLEFEANDRYSYGRKKRRDLINESCVKLPIKYNTDGTPFTDTDKKYSEEGYVPDWQFMEDYIDSLHYKPLTTKNKKESTVKLNVHSWQYFKIKEISNVYTGSDLILSMVEDGKIPVASHKAENNGVGALVEKIDNRQLFDCGKTIALADRGCFHASVQTNDFYIGTRVKAIEMRKDVSKSVLIFIATIINKETFKYSYGRNCTAGVENVTIKLPVKHNQDGTIFIDKKHTYSEKGYVPDWQFMEKYIKSLPYGDRL